MKQIGRRCKAAAQRLIFAMERFGQHELANHAAAGAYAFLLSATPAVLLVVGLASALLGRSPRLLGLVIRFITTALGPLGSLSSVSGFFKSRLGPVAIFIGGASLVWASRLFVVTVQRGLRLIYAASGRNKVVRDNVLTFALEIACLVVAVAIIAAAEALELVFELPSAGADRPFLRMAKLALDAAPALTLFAFIYLTYLYIPPEKPRRSTALLSSSLCLLAFVLFSEALRTVVDSTHYELLYGVFSRLVVLLVNVYAFFALYFFSAELCYVSDHFDALLFGRFYRLSKAKKVGAAERRLFLDAEPLARSFGRRFKAMATVFAAGSEGRSAFYVCSGKVGIYLGSGPTERRLNLLGPGEVFGEMASFLGEPRSATARAEEDCLLLELPPEVFDLVLKADGDAMRRLADSLSSRLKEANRRLLD